MSLKENVIRARSHIVFILGMAVAFGIAIRLETWKLDHGGGGQPATQNQDLKPIKHAKIKNIPSPTPQPLSAEELEWAKIAWRYFQVNYQTKTGLVNSVDGYPAATLWDTASYLNALISAHRLGLVAKSEFDSRLSLVLSTLASIPLFEDALPNKSYNTMTLAMVNYKNEPSPKGIGWSAIDIGRVLVPLNIIIWNYPEHATETKKVISHWKIEKLLDNGVMMGATVSPEIGTQYLQEGRLGYEEYAAKSFQLMGYDTSIALRYTDHVSYVEIYGTPIATDSRTPEKLGAHNYIVSEPYILDGLEFGGDTTSRELAWRVYHVQEEKAKATGRPVAVSEDNIDRPPYFVYNTVFTDGKTWSAITDKGQDASEFKSLSIKAVFGWDALYRTPYTKTLIDKVKSLNNPDKGWFSGLYEKGEQPNKAITANTNAIILESLCYHQFGKLVSNF